MDVTLHRDEILRACRALRGLPPRRGKDLLPILTHVLLEARNGMLCVTATDLDTYGVIPLQAEVAGEGALCIPFYTLSDVARTLAAGAVRLHWTAGPALVIEQDAVRLEITGLPVDEFPKQPELIITGSLAIPGEALARLSQATEFAASNEPYRPILNGVHWETFTGSVSFCATNGHRLAHLAVDAEVAPMAEMIVHPKSLQLVRRVLGGEEEIEVVRSENFVCFRRGGAGVVSRLIEGPYPNWRTVIPEETTGEAVVSVAALRRAVERARIISSRSTEQLILHIGMPSPDAVWVSSRYEGLGKFGERIDLAEQITGEPVRMGANAGYLVEILKHIPTAEVRLKYKGPERAMVLEPVGDDAPKLTLLLMPLRLMEETVELPWRADRKVAA
jgi:DNA polymerase-3 subunit beta